MEASADKERQTQKGFLVDLEVKNPPATAGDMASVPTRADPTTREQASPCATLLSLCSRARGHNAGAHLPRLLKPSALGPPLADPHPSSWSASQPQPLHIIESTFSLSAQHLLRHTRDH